MLSPFSLRTLAALGLALVALSACATGKDTAEDAPKFTVNGTTSRSDATPTAAEASKSAEPTGLHLRQADGSFLITTKQPGPGPVDEITANYSDLEEYGFGMLRAVVDNSGYDGTVSGSAPTGVLQWAVGGVFVLNAQAMNLSDDEADLENNAEWHVALLDGEGNNHLDEATQSTVSCNFGVCTLAAALQEAGSFTAEITIRQAGYEPFLIRQPIIVAA